jgi:hypothetical protein
MNVLTTGVGPGNVATGVSLCGKIKDPTTNAPIRQSSPSISNFPFEWGGIGLPNNPEQEC